jgi:uncharacterized membrane protein (DUF4010 family)
MDVSETSQLILRLGVAALGGLAVGIEREWSAKVAGGTRFAGVRTFLLIGLAGGVGAELHVAGQAAASAVVLGGAGLLVVAAYALSAHRGALDATTEVAAVIVLAAGFFAGLDRLALASALSATTALVLVEKSRIHSFVFKLPPEVITAAARFAVLALVILPALPSGPFGPEPGFRPREVWGLVLLFSGMSFAGYIALISLGPSRGYGLAGLLGGLVSSTAVTLTFSRESRASPSLGRALALGVTAASIVLLARVSVVAAVLNPALGAAVAKLLAIPFGVGILVAAICYRRRDPSAAAAPPPSNPLRLLVAMQMVVAFQLFLYLVKWSEGAFGKTGILVSAGLAGLTDLDALTYSLAKLSSEATLLPAAVQGILIGILSNTLFKLALALTLGRGSFRAAAAAGLGAMGGGVGAALVVAWQ